MIAKKKKKKTPYTWDTVYVSSNASEVQRRMAELKEKGWTKLVYRPNNRDCDCSGDVIEGRRPLNALELREHLKLLKRIEREDKAELKRLAKEYGYELIEMEE